MEQMHGFPHYGQGGTEIWNILKCTNSLAIITKPKKEFFFRLYKNGIICLALNMKLFDDVTV